MNSLKSFVAFFALICPVVAQGPCGPHPAGVSYVDGTAGCMEWHLPNPVPQFTLLSALDSSALSAFEFGVGASPIPIASSGGNGNITALIALSASINLASPIQVPGTTSCLWHVPFDTVLVFSYDPLPQCASLFYTFIPAGILPQGFTFFAQATFLDPNEGTSVGVSRPIEIVVQ